MEECNRKRTRLTQKLGTWSPSQLPKGKVAIDTKWVFRLKEDGIKKARLVARGFQLKEDESSKFSYAPVCRMTTLRILISQAVRNDWTMRQVDVPTAFLNSTLNEEIYIKKPKGLNCSEEILKLNRALYGLKISPRCWNDKFSEIMEMNGFNRSQHDYCLYYANDVYLLLFVDDALITGKTEQVENLIKILYNNFKVKDMGEANSFLGMQFNRTDDSLIIIQNKIINKLLKEFNMENCRNVATPMEVGFKIEETEMVIDVPYRQLVCSLMYIAVITRPDLSFAVSMLSRVLDRPTNQTWQAAKRVLRYLNATKEMGLKFEKSEGKLISYSDADWAGDQISKKSVSGFVAFDGSNPIAWFSKKQNCVALSTMEAEYCAASAAEEELINLKGVLCEFDMSYNKKFIIKVDNCSAISLVKNFENSKRGKHIDIKMHFIKDLYAKEIVDVEYIQSECNAADILTKSLCKDKFVKHRKTILNESCN